MLLLNIDDYKIHIKNLYGFYKYNCNYLPANSLSKSSKLSELSDSSIYFAFDLVDLVDL